MPTYDIMLWPIELKERSEINSLKKWKLGQHEMEEALEHAGAVGVTPMYYIKPSLGV